MIDPDMIKKQVIDALIDDPDYRKALVDVLADDIKKVIKQ